MFSPYTCRLEPLNQETLEDDDGIQQLLQSSALLTPRDVLERGAGLEDFSMWVADLLYIRAVAATLTM